jgi:Flp pilus assembly protein TadD
MPLRLPCLLTALCLACAAAWADDAADVQRLIRAGDLGSALQRAERASESNPRDAQLRFLRGVVLMDLKRDDEALVQFSRLGEEFPELPEPFNNLALLHARAGRLQAALGALETALRNDPGHAVARANLGEIHFRLAVQAWETAASAQPDNAALQRRLRSARELLAPPR